MPTPQSHARGEKPSIDCFFFFNDTATTEIYTLSLHDALPILGVSASRYLLDLSFVDGSPLPTCQRSEEHTSELQSPDHLVCRLLLEKKHTAIARTKKLFVRHPYRVHSQGPTTPRSAGGREEHTPRGVLTDPVCLSSLFFLKDGPPAGVYPLPLHDALPI